MSALSHRGCFFSEVNVIISFGLANLKDNEEEVILYFMKFQWNKQKNSANAEKHGLDFADAYENEFGTFRCDD